MFYLWIVMKVKDLKKILSEIPKGMTFTEWNEMDVLIPMNGEFDGMFVSPCVEETGLGELGIEEDSDETMKSFVIVPCGFFEEAYGVPPELN